MTDRVWTSKRERRLWLLAVATVVAIYSTLGLVGELASTLRNRGLIDAAFGWGMLIMAAGFVGTAFRTRPNGAEIGVVLAMAAAYFTLFLRLGVPEERTHLIEYSVVALIIYEALTERAGHRPVPRPALLAFGLTTLIGVLDEVIQSLIPNRVFDPIDILFNTLAALMAVITLVMLGKLRSRRLAR